MEKRKNSLGAIKVCRFCLGQETLSSLYDRNKSPKKDISLPLKILSCLSVEVFPSDKMPTFICQRCKFFMELFYEYKDLCRKADERIMQYVHNGVSLQSMAWPNLLTKIHLMGSKSKPNVMKAITEDGATVHVTSQDASDSEEEEDEENVYNIKIDDGSREVPKCIKVVTSKNEDKEKSKSEVVSHESDSEEEDISGSRIRSSRGDKGRVWPCNQCDCTYPLRQLLELHKKQKHRARSISCNQCDAKFYKKFHLAVHQVRHSEKMPFQCVACDKKFKRLLLLKRHEKVVHSDLPQLPCDSCPATFLSIEELEAHQSRHERHSERNHACLVCDKRFLHKTTLRKHMDMVHPKEPAFPCEYCPAQFPTVSALTRHVRTHAAGDRLFPCKYCDKSFMRSHHYTRHLRLSHRGESRGSRADQFRCDQCEESFDSQDELIFHSAIHATQNLTCPLCQEKFEDVDAVTAHIKSHVNGIEFMCDLCELVFTSKEKLDTHLTTAHAEELDNEESMEDMDAEEDEDDNGISVKEEDDHMVVEIKKTGGFMLPEAENVSEDKTDAVNSEESEAEATYTELATVDTFALEKNNVLEKANEDKEMDSGATVPANAVELKPAEATDNAKDSQTASILRKAEEVKRKVQQIVSEPTEKKEKGMKMESTNLGASDKSLRLLEKELQELKRTNTRNEAPRTPVRTMETLRNRRPQLHSSTPKTRAESERKMLAAVKSPAIEKKVPERKTLTQIKENKEPKEAKTNSTPVPEEKQKKEEIKEKETPKSVVKNGTSEKSTPEEAVRRSTRPSKIKDYAKMIRDKSQESNDESDDDDDIDHKEAEKLEVKGKNRRGSLKTPVKAPVQAATPPTVAKKRGRPRKDQSVQKEIPSKIRKEDPEEDKASETEKIEPEAKVEEPAPVKRETQPAETAQASADANQSPTSEQKTPAGVLMSPTGQTLKKVPIRALPPGIKPLPLPANARPTMGAGELCEMQIGKKVVKVQKIVMTKAEVEAMAKKGLVEMKDGTMVLKQGIKIPTSDTLSLKSTLVGEKDAGKESPLKSGKP